MVAWSNPPDSPEASELLPGRRRVAGAARHGVGEALAARAARPGCASSALAAEGKSAASAANSWSTSSVACRRFTARLATDADWRGRTGSRETPRQRIVCAAWTWVIAVALGALGLRVGAGQRPARLRLVIEGGDLPRDGRVALAALRDRLRQPELAQVRVVVAARRSCAATPR